MHFIISITFFQLVSLSMCDKSNVKLEQKECPDGFISINDYKCINYSRKKFNFTDSIAYCKKNLNSNLIMIRSKEENKQLARLLFDELRIDEFFWMGGQVLNKKSEFRWLDDCVATKFSNFHVNDHQFNLQNGDEEYLVLSSAMNVNSIGRKERGLWCSFRPQIMLLAICEYYLPDNQRNCSKEINFLINNRDRVKAVKTEVFETQESSESSPSILQATRTHLYLIVASTLILILLVLIIYILVSRFLLSKKSSEVQLEPIEQLDMY